MLDKNLERRKYPRGRGDVDYLFAVQVEDIVSETKDISAGGMMCKVNRYFKPKALIHVTFILPLYTGPRVSFDKIKCKARVVRCEPYPEIDDPDCHVLAMEFVDVAPAQKTKINKYVKHALNPGKAGKKSSSVSVKISPNKA